MIYTMNGMTTRLNLQAAKTGVFHGMSSHYSGDGFADMNFEVHAVAPAEFSDWVNSAGKAADTLDQRSYTELTRQSSKVTPANYRLGDPDLFQSIATQKLPPGPGPQDVSSTSPSGGADVR
jgi:cytochrome o ubiquinol oxidase subunit II